MAEMVVTASGVNGLSSYVASFFWVCGHKSVGSNGIHSLVMDDDEIGMELEQFFE